MEKHKTILVYGTLRKKYGNHRLISHCEQIGTGWTKKKYQLTASGIPFVHPNKPVHQVRVEAYKVPMEDMPSVDGLEGHPEWYKREEIDVILDDGQEIKGEIYFNTDEGSTLIESGDFEDYR